MKNTIKNLICMVMTLVCCQTIYGQQGQSRLLQDIENFRKATTNLSGDDNAKALRLEQVYNSITLLNTADYSLQDIQTNANAAISKLFQGRIDLRHSLQNWERRLPHGVVNERLANAIRKIFRAFRTAEDMLGEIQINHQKLAEGEQALTAFQPTNNSNLVVFNNQPLQIKSGDVIVMRGNRHNSAAIAKITEEDSQFSHALIVYFDQQGKGHAVESLIETGLVIHDLDHILNEGVGRMILLRYPDQNLAHKAAATAYQRAQQANGREPYDFSMSLYKTLPNGHVVSSYDAFFCSKVVSYAFDIASNGSFVPGRYLSKLPQQANGDFLQKLGVTAYQTIAPGDLEMDTQFQLIAEWRDFRITQDLRLKEAVFDKLYELMEQRGYKFRNSTRISMIASTAKALSYMPVFDQLITMLAGEIPSYMTESVIGTMMMMQFTADPMYKDLIELDASYSARTGYSLSPAALSRFLEQNLQQGRYRLEYLRRQ